MLRQRQCLLLPFLRYCCPKLGRYCDPPSGTQGAKGLTQSLFTLLSSTVNANDKPFVLVVKIRRKIVDYGFNVCNYVRGGYGYLENYPLNSAY